LGEHEFLIRHGLRAADEEKRTPAARREMHVESLQGAEILEHDARRGSVRIV
jgi:hypothetical protein